MKIGIIASFGKTIGGSFHYYVSLLNALRKYGHAHEIYVFYTHSDFSGKGQVEPNFKFISYKRSLPIVAKVLKKVPGLNLFIDHFLLTGCTWALWFKEPIDKKLRNCNLDIIICTAPNLVPYIAKIQYIYVIHDLWFMENAGEKMLGAKTRKDDLLRKKYTEIGAKNAKKILVDSALGKKHVMQAYNIRQENISVLPTGPAGFIWDYKVTRFSEVKAKYSLPEYYVFYPAHFLPFKNHEIILKALAILRNNYNLLIDAVFCTPSEMGFADIEKLVEKYDMRKQTHIHSYLADEDMPLIYKGALCLCMASRLGPTNMPIWEAMAIGCPVVSSSIGDQPNQVGQAGLLFEPDNAEDLAKCILRIYTDEGLRKNLIKKGFERAKYVHPDNWGKMLFNIIEHS